MDPGGCVQTACGRSKDPQITSSPTTHKGVFQRDSVNALTARGRSIRVRCAARPDQLCGVRVRRAALPYQP
jgi:hypothetical protein